MAKKKSKEELAAIAEAKASIFPRHVYKSGGDIPWGRGHSYAAEYVTNEAEYRAALKSGYVDNFSEAVFGKEEDANTIKGDFSVPKKKDVVEDDDF